MMHFAPEFSVSKWYAIAKLLAKVELPALQAEHDGRADVECNAMRHRDRISTPPLSATVPNTMIILSITAPCCVNTYGRKELIRT